MPRICSGRYVFGRNIPVGTYDLKAISGTCILKWKTHNDNFQNSESFGVEDGDAKEYRGMEGIEEDWFALEGDIEAEILKSKPILFDD